MFAQNLYSIEIKQINRINRLDIVHERFSSIINANFYSVYSCGRSTMCAVEMVTITAATKQILTLLIKDIYLLQLNDTVRCFVKRKEMKCCL